MPTLREAGNIPDLLRRLAAVRDSAGLDLRVLIVDDNSADGTAEAVTAAALPWAAVHVRSGPRDLSRSVIDGLRLAPPHASALIVMDADLSHPPETIPAMLAALRDGAEMVVASRYMTGGSTDAEWGVVRWLQSHLAGLLARPLVRLTDPMSGFFALTPEVFSRGDQLLDPIGYKIGLELIVRCRCRRIAEVPIHFTERRKGKSKFNLRIQWQYLRHILRLLLRR